MILICIWSQSMFVLLNSASSSASNTRQPALFRDSRHQYIDRRNRHSNEYFYIWIPSNDCVDGLECVGAIRKGLTANVSRPVIFPLYNLTRPKLFPRIQFVSLATIGPDCCLGYSRATKSHNTFSFGRLLLSPPRTPSERYATMRTSCMAR